MLDKTPFFFFFFLSFLTFLWSLFFIACLHPPVQKLKYGALKGQLIFVLLKFVKLYFFQVFATLKSDHNELEFHKLRIIP